MTRDIFKIQRPIVGSDVLVYNQDRSIMGQPPYNQSWRQIFLKRGMPLKFYVECSINDEGQLLFDGTEVDVEEPSW